MKVFYQVSLDDPQEDVRRFFVREVARWPFLTLPSPGDAVGIDVEGRWELVSDKDNKDVNTYTFPEKFQPRRVDQTVYFPDRDEAHVIFRVDASVNSVRSQVEALISAGFEEVDPPH